MTTQPYTVFIVGSHSTAVRKLHVTPRRVRLAAMVGAVAALAAAGLLAHYASLLAARHHDGALRRENAHLRAQLEAVKDRVAHIAATLDRVDGLDARLRGTVAGLQPGSARAPALAGRGDEPSTGVGASSVPRNRPAGPPLEERPAGAAPRPIQLVPSHARPDVDRSPSARIVPRDVAVPALLALEDAAARQERALVDAEDYFAAQRALLASAPSAWPARGLVTSDFGDRLDPYTADRMMHRGLDIAAAPGTAVEAPSDATVAFAGTENGYGKVLILDHGNGLHTRYGHLSHIFVKAGDRVTSGERVGTVGSTGRSTGPHLHYEVRVNGIAENPRKFILQ